MSFNIRLETPNDHYAVELLTREAFWGFSTPTCDEHYFVHQLRNVPAFVPELDFVAEMSGTLVGNVMYSKSKVVNSNGVNYEVLTFGPLSVLPQYWNSGIGTALMNHSILAAKRLGHRAIIIHGHPDYYPRFGFQNAKVFGITDSDGNNFDALMALELYEGALNGVSGRFYEDSIFEVNEAAAKQFDKRFPPKEPARMISIDVLLKKLPSSARKAFINHNIPNLAWLNRLSGRELLEWDGIHTDTLALINEVLKEHGYSEKLLPDSDILQRAKQRLRF